MLLSYKLLLQSDRVTNLDTELIRIWLGNIYLIALELSIYPHIFAVSAVSDHHDLLINLRSFNRNKC